MTIASRLSAGKRAKSSPAKVAKIVACVGKPAASILRRTICRKAGEVSVMSLHAGCNCDEAKRARPTAGPYFKHRMYRPCGMVLNELPRTTAATKQVLAICAAYMLVVRLLTPFEVLRWRDQVHPVQLREGKEIEVEFHWHGFSESYSDCRSGHGKEQIDPKFSPMITEFDVKLLHAPALHQKKYLVDIVRVHLDYRIGVR